MLKLPALNFTTQKPNLPALVREAEKAFLSAQQTLPKPRRLPTRGFGLPQKKGMPVNALLPLGGAALGASKAGAGRAALGFLGRFAGAVAFALAVQTIEKALAPLWFDWLEKFTGFRFRGQQESVPSLPPGTYELEAFGSFTYLHWWDLADPTTDQPDGVLTRVVNPYRQANQVTFTRPVQLVAYRISFVNFPLSGGVVGFVSQGDYILSLVFSDGKLVPFDLDRRIIPGVLGPFYRSVWIKPTFSVKVRIRRSSNPTVVSNTVIEYKPVTINQVTAKKVNLQDNRKTVNINVPRFSFSAPVTVSPKFSLAPKFSPKFSIAPKLSGKVGITIQLRPASVPDKVPEFLQPPEVEPELERIRDLLIRILEKECPPPCPPCEKETGPDGGEQEPEPEEGGGEGGEPQEIPEVLLFWVDKIGDDFLLQQGSFKASVPDSVLGKVEWTAKTFWRVASSQPLVAATPEEELPWKQPLGPHLKVIWCPLRNTAQGYYSFKVPHWVLGKRDTLSLNWGSLTWEKGLRNHLLVRFSSGKQLSLFGDSLENLEAIFNFCLQGVQTGLGFEVRKTTSSQSTSRLSLKVKKLEFWTSRAGHPEWWSWWPPL